MVSTARERDRRFDLLQDARIIIHVQYNNVRKSCILQTKRIGEISIPLLILSIRRSEPFASEPFSRSVERVDHLAGELRELAKLFRE